MRILKTLGLVACLFLAACQPQPTVTAFPTTEVPSETQTAPAAASPVPSETPQPNHTPTLEPGLALMVVAQEADLYGDALFAAWQAETARQGFDLTWSKISSVSAQDLTSSVRLVVIAPGALTQETLAPLAGSAPQAHFVVFDLPGLVAGANVTVVGPIRFDQQGFIAGYIAAMVTTDWRVGVLSPTDTAAGQAASAGFLNGAVFFCGLCNPYYGPIVDYPLAAGRPAGATTADWLSAAQELLDQSVNTIYLGPGVNDPQVVGLLVEKGVKLIGSQPMPAEAAQAWILSVLPGDHLARALLPSILSGAAGQAVDFPIEIVHINPALLSPGRQALAETILADMLSGFIDTGVESAP